MGVGLLRRRGAGRSSLVLALLAVLGALALSWFDVLPGGWRLRSFVGYEGVRQAAERDAHRADRLALFERNAPAPGGVLFIGSSTVEGFDLMASFPRATVPLHNRGIGDEPLASLTERFRSTVERTECRAVVLYAASVDARRPTDEDRFRDDAQLGADVFAMVDDVLESQPELLIALLGVLPETDDSRGVAARSRGLNRRLVDGCVARARVTFVGTTRPPIVDASTGLLNPTYARDRLHLNQQGYEFVAQWLLADAPELTELLGG